MLQYAGAMLPMIKNIPIGRGPKKNLEKAFKQLANNILKCTTAGNIYQHGLTVSVTIKNGKIVDIKILSHHDKQNKRRTLIF